MNDIVNFEMKSDLDILKGKEKEDLISYFM